MNDDDERGMMRENENENDATILLYELKMNQPMMLPRLYIRKMTVVEDDTHPRWMSV